MSIQAFHTIPSMWWMLFYGLFLFVAWCGAFWYSKKWLRQVLQWVGCTFLGCLLAIWQAQKILSWQLPLNLEGKTVEVIGVISSLPQYEDRLLSFDFLLHSLNSVAQVPVKIRLSWYSYPDNLRLYSQQSGISGRRQHDESPEHMGLYVRMTNRVENDPENLNAKNIYVGDMWRFSVRLKRPHGLLNPGTFDFEQWLFLHKLRATGYIVAAVPIEQSENFFNYPLSRMRQWLQHKLQRSLADQPSSGLLIALIMGAQNGISKAQWAIMRATGTNHLMAIAGVHIGFIAGFIYFIVDFIWRRIPRCVLYLPSLQAGAIGALLAALIYSGLAGFALPTQRALIMLSVFSLGIFLRRQISIWNAFILALLAVLLWDPFAVFSMSFWLSFGAVFAILYGISARMKPRGFWWKYGRVQWVVALGLLPISLWLFQQTSLISLAANAIAIPGVGFLVLPLCFIGVLGLFVSPSLGDWLLKLAAQVMDMIWWVLTQLSDIPGAVWQKTIPNHWILIISLIGILLLLMPRGLPGRWLGLFWLVPLFYYRPALPEKGDVWLTLLDVGQGLAAVIRTHQHTLVFDTGPRIKEGEDAGQRVILSFLQMAGVSKIDTLLISHGDMDHIGGANSVLRQMLVSKVLTSVPLRFSDLPVHVRKCQAGQMWEWDGITFHILHPPIDTRSAGIIKGNNNSCVLRVEKEGGGLFLLTGDIEKAAEYYLVQHHVDLLAAEILIAPHHGSRTSSTSAFMHAVRATYVLFPIGYRNRYRFPSQQVVANYKKMGAILLDTAQSGAITVKMEEREGERKIQVEEYRKMRKKIWSD